MARRKSYVPKPERLEMERACLQLKQKGLTYDAIAQELGLSNRSVAWKAVQGALRRANLDVAQGVKDLELSRLDVLTEAVWPAATDGDVKSVREAVRISQHRARIEGLYAPTKSELVVSLDERQAALIVGAIGAILSDLRLTPEQREMADLVVPRHLRALEGPEPSAHAG